jgi:hypothetical protein
VLAGELVAHRLDSPAQLVNLRTLHCTTPAWGATFPGTLARLLVVSDDPDAPVHLRVAAAALQVPFFEVWEGSAYALSFGARGGDAVAVRAFGLDPSARYFAAFQDEQANVAVAAANATTVTELTLTTPAWGAAHPAARTPIPPRARPSRRAHAHPAARTPIPPRARP